MELRDALIPALVLEAKVEQGTHNVRGFGGEICQGVGRRVKMIIELKHRNKEELDWLWQSLQENGNRISLVPDGSAIMHPQIVLEKVMASTAVVKTDQPKTLDSSW